MAYTESEVYAMHVVVVRCPRVFRWLLRTAFKVCNLPLPYPGRGYFFVPAHILPQERNRKGASNMELKVFKDTIAS